MLSHEDYEFYHTDNGKFVNEKYPGPLPADGIYDFNELMEQQSLIDLTEHYEYYRTHELLIPDWLYPYVHPYNPAEDDKRA